MTQDTGPEEKVPEEQLMGNGKGHRAHGRGQGAQSKGHYRLSSFQISQDFSA